MVTDFLVGFILGVIGLKVAQNRMAQNKINSMSAYSFKPMGMGGFSTFSPMQFNNSFSMFNKDESKLEFYELGKTDMQAYCEKYGHLPLIWDRDVLNILNQLESNGTENEIRYKLEILKHDMDVAITYLSKNGTKGDLKFYKPLQKLIDAEIEAINVSLKTFKLLYLPNHTDVSELLARMDSTDEEYISDLIMLGNNILDSENFRDGKVFKNKLIDIIHNKPNEKLDDYLTNVFEPKYKDLVLKKCA